MTAAAAPTLPDLFRVFLRIGLLSFGGPAAQISLMHRTLVDETGWLEEKQFLNALSFCMLLPGPEAMQLATYSGWRLHGVAGGLIAGLLFVLPGAAVIFALAAVYAMLGDVPLVASLFLGVKAAVLIIVIEALLRVSRKALSAPSHWAIAVLAFIGLFFLALPYPLIVAAAAIYGAVFGTRWVSPPHTQARIETSARGTAGTVALWLAIWLVPIAVMDAVLGTSILGDIGAFFSKLAVVTFGGAYAVLAYMAQEVVADYGWLTAGEMMDGLGLAETTPGPLILVTQFVGFLAAFREGGLGYGLAGGVVALWATFAPCFLWIFAGAPYIEWISAQRRLSGALSGITAAVVGVIANLSLWFALHVFFAEVTRESAGILTLWTPTLSTLDWRVPVLALLAGVLLLRVGLGLGWVLGVASLAGLALSALG
ncbi:MAG: chromate efflux transporter [Rhodobacteraceae bacterium]|nr:chromate efflux transporter [Alphaproteobacteria bacterium]NNK67575.1 chromate efflux transporter [Paracoccaceae bacterium]